jgi:LEA14-like dessication related protein
MKKTFVLIVTAIVFICLFPNSCSYLKELTALADCDFRMSTLEYPLLAGVDISDINSIEAFTLEETGKIAKNILLGDLPLSFILNIEVKNPNPVTASLNRMEYIAFIDDLQVAAGAVEERIEIPPLGGISTIPVRVETNLVELFKKESRNTLINFGLNLADASKKPTRVSIEIKPFIRVGSKDLEYPGYITVKKEF